MLNSDAKISDKERKLKQFDGAPVHYCWWWLQICEDFPTDATSAAVTLSVRGCMSLSRGVLAAWNYYVGTHGTHIFARSSPKQYSTKKH